MKTLLILLLLLCGKINAQDSLCKERGHIIGGWIESTAMGCPDKIIEYADSTVLIIRECNHSKTKCKRCGQYFSLPNPPDKRIVLWRRKKL